MAVLVILVSLISLYIAYRLYLHYFPAPNINPAGKHVLISGCDTGFGHALAIALDQRGFHVAAGVYVRENIAALQSKLSSNATVFRLDITKQDEIDAAVELVRKKTNTLHALVNNAGIGTGGYIDWTSLQTMRQTMDVNFFGHVAMTKAFLPLLISKRDSRVVNITSVAGFLAGPSMSAYASSKFALEAFSDCLRREMTPWGLRVSIVEPGFMRTPIIDGIQSTFEDFWTKLSSNEQTRWGEEFLKAYHLGRANNAFIKHAEDPAKVVRAFEHAVTNSAPCIRYRPGWQSSLIFFPLSLMPTSFVDWFLGKTRGHTAVPASVQQQVQG